MNAAPGTALWPRRDRIAVAALQATGFAVLAVSWLGVSGTTRFSRQIAWANLGAAGLIVIILGCALVVHRGRRQVDHRLGTQVWPTRASGPISATPSADRFVATPEMTRYHRPDCQAVAGKSVSSASPDAHRAEGRQPCGLCSWETP